MKASSIKGNVFNIQRYCIQDGKGVRTTVFLKGCYLRCIWCANPESQLSKVQYVVKNSLCIGCGTCFSVCGKKAISLNNYASINQDKCIGCGECESACLNRAIKHYGDLLSVEDVMNEVRKDLSYYKRTGGGLTVSGGEPCLQAEFVDELFMSCKEEGISTCIETCGMAPVEKLLLATRNADTIFCDLKFISNELHQKYTASDNKLILDNIKEMNKTYTDSRLVIRIPLIPQINAIKVELEKMVEFISTLDNVSRIGLLPYHKYGINKYLELNKEYLVDVNTLNKDEINDIKKIFEKTGKEVEIGI